MVTREIIATIIVIAIASCSEEGSKRKTVHKPDIKESSTIDSSLTVIEKDSTDSTRSFNDPLDINEFKKSSFLETTSSRLSKSETKMFCKPKKDGFFRLYFLIDKDHLEQSPFGDLKVFVPDEPNNWRADFEHEDFAEIKLKSGRVKLWNTIGIGTHIEELKCFIGENQQKFKDSIFTAKLGKYSLSAIIKKDTIKELRVSKYCKL